jgi:hypothetical protein
MAKSKLVLSKHRNGQWYKKLKGKYFYFGTDFEKAVEEYLACKDHLLAGRGKPVQSGDPTLAELANLYHAGCRQRVSSGVKCPPADIWPWVQSRSLSQND